MYLACNCTCNGMLLDVIEHVIIVMHVMHHVIDVITDQLQCITCCPLHYMTLHPAKFHYMHIMVHVMWGQKPCNLCNIDYMTITSSNIPLHACNRHEMGHVMDVITCITWWSIPLQSHYIQDVIHVITCPLHAPKDAYGGADGL